jgi:hypothetical protein
MLLKAMPSGSEFVTINIAVEGNKLMDAKPLVPDSAVELRDLRIAKVMNGENNRPVVYVPVKNQLLGKSTIDGSTYRNWNLRSGTKFILKVPVKEFKDVIVLPSEAVIDHGPDKVVFVRDGETFIRRKVIIAYQNTDEVVIAEGSDLLPEEPVVARGAFALQLALIAGTPEAVDPHAGHNH